MSDFTDFKEMESARIQPLLGAVAALPAAALVLGDDASAGAPLFLVSMTCAAIAYVMWMCSDAVFAVHFEHDGESYPGESRRLEGVGYYMSWCTYVYGAASIGASALGFAAVHSTLRSGLSAELGFLAAFAFFIAAASHGAHAVHLRNIQEDLSRENTH